MAHWIAAGNARPSLEVRLGGLVGSIGMLAKRLLASRSSRLAAVLTLALVALCAGCWLWFRDSSFAAVRRVQISGVSGPGAAEIEAALRRTAGKMSTLDVDAGALRAAVAAYPQVQSLGVRASFPHELRITVNEQLPVAVLEAPRAKRTAAAADGAVLGGELATSALPVLTLPSLPTRRVRSSAVLQYLTVLGAAAAPLRALVSRVYVGPKGLTVAMRDGMLVIFGDASLAHAKWLSFARVLLAEGSASAAYVDVRLPKRPAVSGGGASQASSSEAQGGAGASQASSSEAQGGGAEQAGALAAGGAEAKPGGIGQVASGAAGAPTAGPEPSSAGG
jgi:cell division protein FtsQ